MSADNLLRDSLVSLCSAAALLVVLGTSASCGPEAGADEEPAGRIHASTVSREALLLYLQALRLQENLRHTEAYDLYLRAIEKDGEFALAHLGAAQTSPSRTAMFTHLEQAVALADLASEGEKHLIYAHAAGVNDDPVAQERHAQALVELHGADERAHGVLANLYFERKDYAQAIRQYERAIALNPQFAPPYNQLGYAHRYNGDYAAAKRAFEKYVELIPDEPNPYDSYAELLMKMGSFEESIDQYHQALERDPAFAASRIGVGVNQIFLEDAEAARATFESLLRSARHDGERREALTWLAYSYIFERRFDLALREVERRMELAQASGDRVSMAGDLGFMGRILLEAGRVDEAARRFEAAQTALEESGATAEVKQASRHEQLCNHARIALARGDLEAASAAAEAYGRLVDPRSAGEARAFQELYGRIALAREEWTAAVDHLSQADVQSAGVLFLLAKAYRGAGDLPRAREFANQAGNWNALGESYAFVRAKARALGAELAEPAAGGDC